MRWLLCLCLPSRDVWAYILSVGFERGRDLVEVEAGAGGKGRVLQIVRLVARARRHAHVLCQLDDLLQGRAACMSGSSLCCILLWGRTVTLHSYNNSTRSGGAGCSLPVR